MKNCLHRWLRNVFRERPRKSSPPRENVAAKVMRYLVQNEDEKWRRTGQQEHTKPPEPRCLHKTKIFPEGCNAAQFITGGKKGSCNGFFEEMGGDSVFLCSITDLMRSIVHMRRVTPFFSKEKSWRNYQIFFAREKGKRRRKQSAETTRSTPRLPTCLPIVMCVADLEEKSPKK